MTMLGGRYELAELVGSGGMADVYAAADQVLRRNVAVKIIHSAHLQDPVSRERFAQEARVAAGLQHPNTVAVYDVGEDAGRPFIVMELVEGRSLADRIRDEGRLPADDVVPITVAVLDGLQAAHDRRLVHRDVKPSNILLPARGGVKLADFGIAASAAEASLHLTGGGEVLGTPKYLAPERVAGERATPASDLYSLGAVMYECLAGQPPFVADTPVAVAVAHQRDPVRPLRTVVPGIEPGIAAVAERALAKDPAARFGSAAEMRHALLAAPAGAVQPDAVPVDVTQHLPVPPPVRRRWLPVVAGLLVAAVLGIAAAYLLNRGDEPGGTASPTTPVPDAQPDAEPDAGEPADDAPADDAAPSDLTGLIGTVAAGQATGGEKASDLLDGLSDLATDPNDRDARELIEEVGGWLAAGELDADLGRTVIDVLEQESRPSNADLASVSELFAEVSGELTTWGTKSENLASDLRKLLDTDPPGQQIQQARKLSDELDKWIAEGEIVADRGSRAHDALAPLR